MLFWFFLLLYHVLLKCYNRLINSFLNLRRHFYV
nr:MAG TPA: hypothetical protein [Bacteriophage sp.]